jgi:hypothetical protein
VVGAEHGMGMGQCAWESAAVSSCMRSGVVCGSIRQGQTQNKTHGDVCCMSQHEAEGSNVVAPG